jgi:ribosomal protein S18 acetylase RimI-like enzyme
MGSNAETSRAANLFAEYAPRAAKDRRPNLNDILIRPSCIADRDALAEIAWRRNGGLLADMIARFHRDLANHPNPPDDLWLTALVDQRIVGYGKVSSFVPTVGAPPNSAPPGYYLGGVTVHDEFRRGGIGRELTRQRLLWIAPRAAEAYYFANAQNRASIDLHARFGFVEVTRDFSVPSATFTGGIGILFRIDLRSNIPI